MITISLETIILITTYFIGLILNILTGKKFAKYLHDTKLFSRKISLFPAYMLLVIAIIFNLIIFTLSTTITTQIGYFTTRLDPIKTIFSLTYTLTTVYLSYRYYEKKYQYINKPLTFIGKTLRNTTNYIKPISRLSSILKYKYRKRNQKE